MKMKLILIATIFINFFASINAQVIKVESGISTAWASGNFGGSKKIIGYTGAIAVDYLDKDWFYLSSELGYVRKGDKGDILESDGSIATSVDYKQIHDYITFSTSFRFKYKTTDENLSFYAGIAPTVDFLLKAKMHINTSLEPALPSASIKITNAKDVVFGYKPEIGACYDVSDKIMLELNIAYRGNITKMRDLDRGDYNGHIITTMLAVGYKF